MTIIHSEMVAALVKPGQAILDSLTPEKCHLLHMAVGVVGEIAELVDGCLKHGEPDFKNIVEEFGDAEFYLEGTRQAIGVTRESLPVLVDGKYASEPLVGLVVMSGELLDVVKKHVIYNKGLCLETVINALSLIEFYMKAARQDLTVERESTLAANIAKLGKRYSEGSYSDKAAQDRADKVV